MKLIAALIALTLWSAPIAAVASTTPHDYMHSEAVVLHWCGQPSVNTVTRMSPWRAAQNYAETVAGVKQNWTGIRTVMLYKAGVMLEQFKRRCGGGPWPV